MISFLNNFQLINSFKKIVFAGFDAIRLYYLILLNTFNRDLFYQKYQQFWYAKKMYGITSQYFIVIITKYLFFFMHKYFVTSTGFGSCSF